MQPSGVRPIRHVTGRNTLVGGCACRSFWANGRDFTPAGASSGFGFAPRQVPPKKASLAGCPAELAPRLWRCAHTAAGNQKDFQAVRDACARTGGAVPLHLCMLHRGAGSLRRPAATALRDRAAIDGLTCCGCLSAAHQRAASSTAGIAKRIFGSFLGTTRKELARRGEIPASAFG